MSTFINNFQLMGEEVEAHRLADTIFIKRNRQDKKFDQFTQDEFNQLLTEGLLVPTQGKADEPVAFVLTDLQKIKLKKIENYLKELKQYPSPCSARSLRRAINTVRLQLKDHNPPSPSTLYKWFRKDRDSGLGLAGTFAKRFQPNRGPYSSDEAVDLALSVFDDHYLKLNGASAAECYAIFTEEFARNKSRDISGFEGRCPSKATFYRWKERMIPQGDVVAARQGASAARAYTRNVMRKFNVEDMLDRVEIDALNINIGLKDEFGNVHGPVTLYVAIDVYTRMILGYYIQLSRGESASGFIHCLLHAFNPKPSKDESGLINSWPTYGAPGTIVADPSAAIQSLQLQTFVHNIKSSLVVTQAGQGWKKPFIERWFGTLRTQFLRKLPGYAGKRTDEKAATIDMKRHATMTAEEFETLLVEYIVDDYHQRPHYGLNGRTPHQVWTERLKEMPVLMPLAINNLGHIWGDIEKRVLSHKGIEANKTFYWSAELGHARDALPEGKREVDVLIDSEDIGSIVVLLPDGEPLIVPAINFDEVSGLSKAQWKARLKQAAQGHHTPLSPQPSVDGKHRSISSSERLGAVEERHGRMLKEQVKNRRPRPQARQETVNQSAEKRQQIIQGVEERRRKLENGFNPLDLNDHNDSVGGFDID